MVQTWTVLFKIKHY